MSADAIIFIPGIKGTKLVDTNRATWDTIWSGIQSNFETIEDLELTALYKNRYFDENPDSIIAPSEIETLAYGEFLNDLNTNKPVYIFNYDWRLSASENGSRLKEYLDYLIDKSNAMDSAYSKKFKHNKNPIKTFDFITHSLGNFILRNYLHNSGFSKVNKIVFTVPPFKGSLDIVSAAVIGEGFFPKVKSKIRKLLRTMPGALELLPKYDDASNFKPKANHNFFNFNHWQSNIITASGPIPTKLKKALSLANKVVNDELCDLSKLSKEKRERILIIARGGFDTWQSVSINKTERGGLKNFVDFENGLRTKDGDGRVPNISSCHYCNDVKTLMLENAFWYREYSHGMILKDERVQKMVNRFLFGNKKFDHKIPGGSIKVVKGWNKKIDEKKNLPFWSMILKN